MKKTLIAFFTSVLFIISLQAYAQLPSTANGEPIPSLAPMLKKVMPCVVNISVIGEIPTISNPFAGEEGAPTQPKKKSPNAPSGPQKFGATGSGVIVNAAKGYIVTNAHVLRDAKSITVTLKDGRQFTAKLIGSDTASDLAVLQIKASGLTQLPLGNSQKLQVGDFVVAIGSPFGLSQTVTSGIVSALQRSGLGLKGFQNFIQTDAPINPGNSGGALINLQGQLVGINKAILTTEDGGNVGINFAIPVNSVKSIMAQLIKYGSVHHALMGVMIQNLTPSLAKAFHQPTAKGGVVTQINPYSPAAKAGIRRGDIIEKVNGTNVNSASDISNMVGLLRAGSKINLSILRQGKPMHILVVTASAKQYKKISEQENPFFYGVNLHNFNQINALHGDVQGVQILNIAPNAPASLTTPTPLIPGDVIISVNQQPVKNITELMHAVKNTRGELLLNVLRGGGAMFVVMNPETLAPGTTTAMNH